MNRIEFLEKLKTEKSEIDSEWICDVIKKSVETSTSIEIPRGERNLITVMEELSELQKAISKSLRGKGDRVSLIEEYADVMISLLYIKDIFNISDTEINTAMNVKIHRIEDTLNKNGTFK